VETGAASARLPVRFKSHMPHAYMKTLVGRRPALLCGGELPQQLETGKVHIAPDETVVILWE
jgi:hypothetical protein